MLLPREGHDERRESSTPQLPRPITVMIASDRQALLLAKMARLMHEPGIELHAESLTDPARLGYSIEQKSPAVLLLDKAMLDRLDGESIQTIRALANAIADLLSASPASSQPSQSIRHAAAPRSRTASNRSSTCCAAGAPTRKSPTSWGSWKTRSRSTCKACFASSGCADAPW